MIRVENLEKSYGDRMIFHDLNMTINDGEVVGIIGPSGSGKSLFLRCLMMLEKPSRGKIILDGEELANTGAELDEARKKIGMVFQTFNLFEHLSVIENVMSGLVHLQGAEPEKAYEEAMRLIKSVGLADKAFCYPSKLSGGQKQRAAIARTLAMRPEIILLDEPTSELDPMMRGEVASVIRMMAAEGRTMVIVTHEMELVRQICTRVVFFNEGELYEEGTPEKIFEEPERTATRRFVRALRVMEFTVESKDFDFIGVQTTIADFAYRNGISRNLLDRMQSIMEELFQMVIIQPTEQHKMHISFEYNNQMECLNGQILFTGPVVDPDDPMYFFSWPIIVKRASEVTVSEAHEEEYTNSVSILIS